MFQYESEYKTYRETYEHFKLKHPNKEIRYQTWKIKGQKLWSKGKTVRQDALLSLSFDKYPDVRPALYQDSSNDAILGSFNDSSCCSVSLLTACGFQVECVLSPACCQPCQ